MIVIHRFSFFISVLFLITLSLSVLNAEPLIKVQWADDQRESIHIEAPVEADEAKECLEAGLDLEHRFLMKVCERVNRFGTVCSDERKKIHIISYDPIQEGYRLRQDLLGDIEEPIGTTIVDLKSALSQLASVKSFTLHNIEERMPDQFPADKPLARHFGLRIRTTCKGETSEFLADLSYFLSFGLVDLYGYDSGWEYYDLLADISSPDLNSPLPRKSE